MINKIRRDKWKHFFVGIGVGIFLQGALTWIVGLSDFPAGIISFFGSVSIHYGFELFSLFTGRGHYDLGDAVAGTIGSAIGIAILFLTSY
jgi:hypothetical protein